MAEQTESLVLEILRRIHSDIAEIKNDIKNLSVVRSGRVASSA